MRDNKKWVSKIQAYDFQIKYVKGKNNVVVDALSRRPATLSLLEISADWKDHLLVEYSKTGFLARYWMDRSKMTGIG